MHTNAYKGGGGGSVHDQNTHFVRRFIENAMSFYVFFLFFFLHKMKTNLLKSGHGEVRFFVFISINTLFAIVRWHNMVFHCDI